MSLRVLIADDHPMVRLGLRTLIGIEPDLELVAEAHDGGDAVTLYQRHRPDVVLMDLRMPRLDGHAAIQAIRAFDATARIIALTTYEGDVDIHRALQAGAVGYLLKDMLGPGIIAAIRDAANGRRVIPPVIAERLAEFTPRVELTPREVEVLRLASKGLSNRDIARVLGRTEGTIKVHLAHLLAKLGASDRTGAVTIALQRGILHLDD